MRHGWLLRKKRWLGPLLNVAGVVGTVCTAEAHQSWANGQPVPAWVTKACCGPAEAHHLQPEQVHRVPNGFVIDGYPGVIADAQVLPSQDGDYWAFYVEEQESGGKKLFSNVFCFFAPTGS